MTLPPIWVKDGPPGLFDGSLRNVDKIWVKDGPPGLSNGTVQEVTSLYIKGTPPNVEPPPPPPYAGEIGIYSSGALGDDSKCINITGYPPRISSDYFQVGDASHRHTVAWGSYRNLETTEAPRLARGTDLLVAISYKAYYGSGTDNSNIGLDVVATGASHADYADMIAIWDYLCDAAEALALAYPARKVFLALPEGEADAKVNKYLTQATGDRCATTAVRAGQAWQVLLARGLSRAPHVQFVLWFAGTQTGIIRTIMSQITSRPHLIIGDPYTNGTRIETLKTAFNDWLNWLRAEPNYARLSALGVGTPIPCGIGEFGMETPAHTDAQVKTYVTGMYQTLIDCGLEFAIWFDSGRDKGHIITDGNHQQTMNQFTTELGLSWAAA